MYDADEQLRDIKDTAQTTANTVKTGMDLAQRLRQLMDVQKSSVPAMAVNDPNFVFSGTSTDLQFFLQHDVMSMDMIRNITDPNLLAAVQSEFNLAAQQGLIDIDPTNNTISITEKGLKHIHHPNFQKMVQPVINDPSFVFTGQSTDLRFFLQHNVMSMDMIRNIADPDLRTAVQAEFNLAAKQGLITIDPTSNTISITEKGIKHIQRPKFQKAAWNDLQSAAQQAQQAQQVQQTPPPTQSTQPAQPPMPLQQPTVDMGYPLNGSMNDIHFFRYADTLDLTAIMQDPNQEVAQKILAGIQNLHAEGKVAIDGLKVTLTEAGKQTLASPIMQAAASTVNCVPTGEPVSTAIVVAVNAVKTAVQTIGNISSGTAMRR